MPLFDTLECYPCNQEDAKKGEVLMKRMNDVMDTQEMQVV